MATDKAARPSRAEPVRALKKKTVRAPKKTTRAAKEKSPVEAKKPPAQAAAPPELTVWKRTRPTPGVKKSRVPSAQQIAEMIEEATVDAYDESEQAVGWYTMISDNLELPFVTEVLGEEAEVVELDMTSRDEIVAICKRGKHKQRLPLLDLVLPEPPPRGYAWIEAFRQWCG